MATPTLMAITIILQLSWNSTLDRLRIPLAATMPNMAKPAPPNTIGGMQETMAASFGHRPKSIIITALVATT